MGTIVGTTQAHLELVVEMAETRPGRSGQRSHHLAQQHLGLSGSIADWYPLRVCEKC